MNKSEFYARLELRLLVSGSIYLPCLLAIMYFSPESRFFVQNLGVEWVVPLMVFPLFVLAFVLFYVKEQGKRARLEGAE